MIIYEEIVREKKLESGGIFQTSREKFRVTCSKKCTASPTCKSYNFCDNKLCQLISKDIYDSDIALESDKACDYVGMRADFAPKCENGEQPQNISDDSNPGDCVINQKRIDGILGEWQAVEMNGQS